jgi:hypothetical protein
MKTCGGSGITAPLFLTSALDGDEWSPSRPGERALGSYWLGRWVGPRAGLNAVEKRKISCPSRESNHSFGCRDYSLYLEHQKTRWLIVSELGYKQRGPSLMYHLGICLKGARKTTKLLSRDRSPGYDSNQITLEYMAETSLHEPICLVWFLFTFFHFNSMWEHCLVRFQNIYITLYGKFDNCLISGDSLYSRSAAGSKICVT